MQTGASLTNRKENRKSFQTQTRSKPLLAIWYATIPRQYMSDADEKLTSEKKKTITKNKYPHLSSFSTSGAIYPLNKNKHVH
jgi:hypothetical protein